MIKFLLSVLKRKIIVWHYNYTKNAHKKPFYPYLKYNDSITNTWYISPGYKEHLNNCIDSYVKKDYKDFFIDVGANIGLMTASNWEKFDNLYCFEPNNLVFKILETNISISCNEKKVKLFNVGLGLEKGKYNLKIPKHNFGGAFLEENNEYSDKTLLEKEGFYVNEIYNYITTEINIESGDFLNENVFNEFKKEYKGVVKIDVEGYELQILELILNTINVSKVVIIFENWQNLDKEIIEKMIVKNNFSSFKIKYIKWLDSFFDKIKSKSIYSNLICLDENESYIPKKCDVILEIEN